MNKKRTTLAMMAAWMSGVGGTTHAWRTASQASPCSQGTFDGGYALFDLARCQLCGTGTAAGSLLAAGAGRAVSMLCAAVRILRSLKHLTQQTQKGHFATSPQGTWGVPRCCRPGAAGGRHSHQARGAAGRQAPPLPAGGRRGRAAWVGLKSGVRRGHRLYVSA